MIKWDQKRNAYSVAETNTVSDKRLSCCFNKHLLFLHCFFIWCSGIHSSTATCITAIYVLEGQTSISNESSVWRMGCVIWESSCCQTLPFVINFKNNCNNCITVLVSPVIALMFYEGSTHSTSSCSTCTNLMQVCGYITLVDHYQLINCTLSINSVHTPHSIY